MAQITRRRLLSSLAAPVLSKGAATRPSILLLLADDLGYGDLSCYGCPDIRTPNLDKLAGEGVRFTRFYSNAPECTPSRTALLTGRYQQRVGGLECAIGLGGVGRYDEAEWLASKGELGLPESETTIGAELSRAGYDTCICGKWHLGYEEKFSPMRHGFRHAYYLLGGAVDYASHTEPDGRAVFLEDGRPAKARGHMTDVLAGHALDWLGKRGSNPWLLYVPFTAPHNPLQAPGDPPIHPARWNEGTRATYAKMVEHMDQRIGDLLAAVARRPDASNTIVVFLSDNGGTQHGRNTPFRGQKSQLFEGGIRVPCIMRWPSRLRRSESAQPAMNFDLTATLLAAAGVEATRKLDGVGLMALLQGKPDRTSRTMFWRYKRGEARRKAVSDGDLKYYDDSGTKYLFDLGRDPAEKNNLATERPKDVERLAGMVARWEVETAALRLEGFRRG